MQTIIFAAPGLGGVNVFSQLEEMGYTVHVFQWEDEFEHLQYSVKDLVKRFTIHLDRYLDQKVQVILLSHSTGALIAGQCVGHPCVLGHVALAPTQHASSLRWIRGASNRKTPIRSMHKLSQVLRGRRLVLEKRELLGLGFPSYMKSLTISGRIIRDISAGVWVPRGDTNNCWYHVSDRDRVLHVSASHRDWLNANYRPLGGGETLGHIDYAGKRRSGLWWRDHVAPIIDDLQQKAGH